jgi:hypothetical protein
MKISGVLSKKFNPVHNKVLISRSSLLPATIFKILRLNLKPSVLPPTFN